MGADIDFGLPGTSPDTTLGATPAAIDFSSPDLADDIASDVDPWGDATLLLPDPGDMGDGGGIASRPARMTSRGEEDTSGDARRGKERRQDGREGDRRPDTGRGRHNARKRHQKAPEGRHGTPTAHPRDDEATSTMAELAVAERRIAERDEKAGDGEGRQGTDAGSKGPVDTVADAAASVISWSDREVATSETGTWDDEELIEEMGRQLQEMSELIAGDNGRVTSDDLARIRRHMETTEVMMRAVKRRRDR